ncbi:hypothetical protein K435DRAFT_835349 [Dendrothele bispora CBS 962.96]|uniref:Uncharacterized protein n=1 Tax=Dendrothele bispora (strain CBS 962.96) TaxID=1314807 RepID=A0A4S8MNI4_DENBC|nr:hypothetical protein K435DRAFT_835349 [Dendrothele bispora CBS 962.96]
MPTPGLLKAPSFSGDTADLKEFFEDFEELTKECELGEEEKVRGVVKYADKEVRKFWKTLKGCDTPNMEKAVEAGRVVFSDEAFDAEWDDSIALQLGKKKKLRMESLGQESADEEEDEDSSEEEVDKPRKRRDTVKQEVQMKAVVKTQEMLDEVEQLASKLKGMSMTDTNYVSTYSRLVLLAPAFAQLILSPFQLTPVTTVAAAPAMPMAPYPPQPVTPATYPNSIPVNPRTAQNGYGRPPQTDYACHFCKKPEHTSGKVPLSMVTKWDPIFLTGFPSGSCWNLQQMPVDSPTDTHGFPRIPTESHGEPQIATDSHGEPWIASFA